MHRNNKGRQPTWDFSIATSLGLMVRTLPFIAFRQLVYFGVALAYVLMTGMGAGVGWGIGGLGDQGFRAASPFWGGVVGFESTAGMGSDVTPAASRP